MPKIYDIGKGFAVARHRIHNLKYSEEGRIAVVRGEILVGSPSFVLYASTFKGWEPPNDQQALSSEHRKEILSRIEAALNVWGVDYVID